MSIKKVTKWETEAGTHCESELAAKDQDVLERLEKIVGKSTYENEFDFGNFISTLLRDTTLVVGFISFLVREGRSSEELDGKVEEGKVND